jgi:hypothetical protein
MSQPIVAPVNQQLIDSLILIIRSLNPEEQQILKQKIQQSHPSEAELQQQKAALQQDLSIGIEHLQNGEYSEYDDSSLPSLLETIKTRGQQTLRSIAATEQA